MPGARTFVVVGASLAGGTAAATLREEGFDGRLVLIGDEPILPYERPGLSKGYLRGDDPARSSCRCDRRSGGRPTRSRPAWASVRVRSIREREP